MIAGRDGCSEGRARHCKQVFSVDVAKIRAVSRLYVESHYRVDVNDHIMLNLVQTAPCV